MQKRGKFIKCLLTAVFLHLLLGCKSEVGLDNRIKMKRYARSVHLVDSVSGVTMCQVVVDDGSYTVSTYSMDKRAVIVKIDRKKQNPKQIIRFTELPNKEFIAHSYLDGPNPTEVLGVGPGHLLELWPQPSVKEVKQKVVD